MASIVIDVIDVSPVTHVDTAKGGYNFIEVAYRKDGKVEGKKIMEFANKEVFKQVKDTLSVGKTYEITLEKINDYWNWTGVTPAVARETPETSTAAQAASGGSVVAARAGGRVAGSNYETPEERKVKQRLIGRQTCLERALGLLIHNSPKGMVDKAAVTEVAEYFNDWLTEVSNEVAHPNDPIENANRNIMAMKDDIPF